MSLTLLLPPPRAASSTVPARRVQSFRCGPTFTAGHDTCGADREWSGPVRFRRPDGDRVLFVWDRLASPVVRVEVPRSRSVMEYDLEGRPSPAQDLSVLRRVSLQPGAPRMFRLGATDSPLRLASM